MKDKHKGALVTNLRPITWLSVMWKLLTANWIVSFNQLEWLARISERTINKLRSRRIIRRIKYTSQNLSSHVHLNGKPSKQIQVAPNNVPNLVHFTKSYQSCPSKLLRKLSTLNVTMAKVFGLLYVVPALSNSLSSI